MTESKGGPAEARKLRVAVVGIGWWSDVLADAALRSDAIDIAACYTRSDDKRAAWRRNPTPCVLDKSLFETFRNN
jgi:hypothetical protein